MITIYTDGSYRGTLRTGGYAAFITDEYGNYMLLGDGCKDTTISRMELSAMVAGLSMLQDGCEVTLISDSQYACNVVNKWIWNWSRTNFTKVNGETVSNIDIIQQLFYHLQRMKSVKAVWIKSHTGYTDYQSIGNDICDMTAFRCATHAAL